MAEIYYDRDANMDLLQDKTIAIIGYGSQGHAHAQNLRDSGCKVIVASRPNGSGWRAAREHGFRVLGAREATGEADIITMLAPDNLQSQIYNSSIEKELCEGKTLMFAHGFNIHYSQIVPPSHVDVSMIAPKCPGHMLRQLYVESAGPPAIIAVHQDVSGEAKDIALAYAKGIGCTRAGVIETTFAEETETDLFGEQAVLCGGVTSLIKAGFDTLVEAGYQPECAYYEVLHELKLIVDLIQAWGMNGMRRRVSDTAEYGDMSRGPRIIGPEVRDAMEEILEEIQTGEFAREWILENRANRPVFTRLRELEAEHPIETVGAKLRKMMPWLTE